MIMFRLYSGLARKHWPKMGKFSLQRKFKEKISWSWILVMLIFSWAALAILIASKNILACAANANVIQKFQIQILNVNEQCSFIGLFHPSKKSIIKWPSRLFLLYLLLRIILIALLLPCIGKTVNTLRSKLLQFRILWPLNYRCGGMCADTELTIIFHFYHVDLL